VRLHPGDPFNPGQGCGGAHNPRLNLLLSFAGWQPDPWVDRLPRLLEPMGVISHRAHTGREASGVISSLPIHIAVVDLGLPLDDLHAHDSHDPHAPETEPEFEEGGPRLLELLSRLSEPPPVVAVKRPRTHRTDARDISAALRLGAFAVIDRPMSAHDLNLMLEVLRRILERHYEGRWPTT
jgi:CheY-like chemotaxis protein